MTYKEVLHKMAAIGTNTFNTLAPSQNETFTRLFGMKWNKNPLLSYTPFQQRSYWASQQLIQNKPRQSTLDTVDQQQLASAAGTTLQNQHGQSTTV